jgi:hypothetical protein
MFPGRHCESFEIVFKICSTRVFIRFYD